MARHTEAIPALSLAMLALAACRAAPAPEAPAAETITSETVCVVPDRVAPAPSRTPPPDEIAADGRTAFHTLAVAWAPQWCETNGANPAYAHMCREADFGFFLHGLWPSAAWDSHPRYCAAQPAPTLDEATVRAHFCMTPSAHLLQHEWAAHGTCGWDSPQAYFQDAAALWNALALPDLDTGGMTAGAVRDAFTQANPGLFHDGVHIATAEGGWLREVRLCFDHALRPGPCLRGLGAPDHVRLRIRPRSGAGAGAP